jgi:hypothetical protein
MILDFFLLLLWFFAAWVIRSWAEAWGKPTLPYFLTSLFFTPMLPAFVLLFKGPDTSLIEASAIAEGKLKRCSHCEEAIRSGAIICRFCGSEQAPAPLP